MACCFNEKIMVERSRGLNQSVFVAGNAPGVLINSTGTFFGLLCSRPIFYTMNERVTPTDSKASHHFFNLK
jgi:hypothetical protein